MWTTDFFNKMYWELFMKRTPEQINNQVSLIISSYQKLKKENPISVLDVCCGVGDILNSLVSEHATHGYGIEYSDDYVSLSKFYYNIQVKKQDAFIDKDWIKLFNVHKEFDLIYNWYSSFAYFSHEKNKQMLKNCFRSLSNNGVFLIESYNSYDVLNNFSEIMEYKKYYEDKEYIIHRHSNINPSKRILEQTWDFNLHNLENKKYFTQSYLYFPDEIISLLQTIGFRNIYLHGVMNNKILKDFSFKDKRWIIICQK